MKLGIDVGGTNTDAVIVRNDGKLLSWSKHLTTKDIITGIELAAKEVLKEANIRPQQIDGIFVGTTHVLNALYHLVNLSNTALIRIIKHPSLIEPAVEWPDGLKKYLAKVYHFESSYDYTGKTNSRSTTNSDAFKQLFRDLKEMNIESICIVGAYSPLYASEELELRNYIKESFPEIPITMSHKIGSTGFIERENATLLNAIVSKVIRQAMLDLSTVFRKLSLECPCWLTQNDGSLMEIQEAIDYPILTIGSGVTNSLRGASILSGLDRCIVVDVGGSTIDIGKILNSQPEVSIGSTSILGIAVNMRVPKMYSLPYGGGSLISIEDESVRIKDTIASDIEQHGISWGGNTWTLTDSFLKVYPDSFSDKKITLTGLAKLSEDDCQKVINTVTREIKKKIARLQQSNEALSIVLVGGGSSLLVNRLFGKYQKVFHPVGFHICNAVGACFAPLSAQVDKVFWLRDKTKQEIIDEEKEQLIQQLLRKGATRDTIQVVSIEEFPFDYLKGEVLRIRLKALGELEFIP
ncbi:hydantoinase/oxoprolinase [Bacillus canaveralius]|uniref:Hydantoinase/oxoprolinase n=1 Tax=Bacillus canaveralius TaxID=1403243 RepID=A0A2N5GGP9_9BACI|nr:MULTISPECIES: hydantoinase/oxoprolinase family protein [Bacillus]PLR79937.1 hydantoinase/oxoprolinase [Bacillus canaveralius]PLR83501.1 hydantoinase/oxoprolinase [Bacillus sp. V33-4]PLR88446.1 hydantoinase/oxoprolinase [Bacillus canaveralius]RSK58164.1 hydantoinase/oxoprolinase family protein [Bacillus canaveralius]